MKIKVYNKEKYENLIDYLLNNNKEEILEFIELDLYKYKSEIEIEIDQFIIDKDDKVVAYSFEDSKEYSVNIRIKTLILFDNKIFNIRELRILTYSEYLSALKEINDLNIEFSKISSRLSRLYKDATVSITNVEKNMDNYSSFYITITKNLNGKTINEYIPKLFKKEEFNKIKSFNNDLIKVLKRMSGNKLIDKLYCSLQTSSKENIFVFYISDDDDDIDISVGMINPKNDRSSIFYGDIEKALENF